MLLDEFDFDLPEALIALRPARPRTSSRLLVAQGERLFDSVVAALGDWLRAGDILVMNDTRVIPARIDGVRTRSGGASAAIEVTLLSATGAGIWRALARPGKRLSPGDVISFADGFAAEVLARDGAEVDLAFTLLGADLDAALERTGKMPLPPYIARRRPVDDRDVEDYQTVFAARSGAVAAPTASLHFDAALLAKLAERGVRQTFVTLHVGAGTFLPVTVNDVSRHRMHAEWGEIDPEAAEQIRDARRAGGRIIPVGTTALRLLESSALGSGEVAPWSGETDIFIRPGHVFRACDGLMTNFHLPKSTLMMLVSALMGVERVHRIYAHAIRERYRFFSYGDSSLLLPEG